MGVEFKTESKVDNLDLLRKEYDAVLLAIGAQLGKRVDIPAIDTGRIMEALNFLADTDQSAKLCVGRRVAVYGGGNTAMDAARTAVRLGATESVIIYRRNQERMPAHQAELDEALMEGVVVNWLRTIKQVNDGEIQVEVMELDAKGNPQPTGKLETVKADMLVLALGQETASDFLRSVPGVEITKDGVVKVDNNMMTGHKGIFAGGDMVPFNKTVTTAVGHGKKAARCIDAYVRGIVYEPAAKNPAARFDRLRTEWYPPAEPAKQPELPAEKRLDNFDETLLGLTREQAMAEAQRCFSCGNCFECDTCRDFCPDQAIRKVGKGEGYVINMEQCSRCGICTQRCPCGSLEMVADAGKAAGWTWAK
jgi:NADPH-dependent glutamate synthase beta subunit-like oxidoreductase